MPRAFSAVPGNYADLIRTFISAHMNSDSKQLDAAMSDDAQFKIPRQDKVIVQNKSDLIDALSKMEGVKQNCTSAYQVIDSSDALVIARVDFKYPEFVQHNYITMERSGRNNWKITQVCKISESKDAKKPASYPVINAVD